MDGFLNTATKGYNIGVSFGRGLLVAGEIPGANLMLIPPLVGNTIAGVGNLLINPSDPVGDAMQVHNAAVDKAIADYKAEVKNCK